MSSRPGPIRAAVRRARRDAGDLAPFEEVQWHIAEAFAASADASVAGERWEQAEKTLGLLDQLIARVTGGAGRGVDGSGDPRSRVVGILDGHPSKVADSSAS